VDGDGEVGPLALNALARGGVTVLGTHKITYDLRRLRLHGLIDRIPHTHRYRVTDAGLRHALFLTRAHTRLLRTGLAEIHGPPVPTKLRAATTTYEHAIDALAQAAGLAA
jgi:Mn-dependent DtxR family transcriptional regulator